MVEIQFLKLIQEHQGIIYKISRLYRDGKEDREDLFQEITFQLWKSYPGFKGEAKISTWIYRIALNTAIAAYRKKRPDLEFAESLPDLPDVQEDEGYGLRQERLFAALKQLNEAEKALITLYLEDQTYQQMADILGINQNYIGVKLNRVKAKIQKILNQ